MLSSVIPCFWARKQASSAVQNNDLPVGPGKQMRSVSRSKRKGIASFDSARAMPDRSNIVINFQTISACPDQEPCTKSLYSRTLGFRHDRLDILIAKIACSLFSVACNIEAENLKGIASHFIGGRVQEPQLKVVTGHHKQVSTAHCLAFCSGPHQSQFKLAKFKPNYAL